jgi:hypothetical protein
MDISESENTQNNKNSVNSTSASEDQKEEASKTPRTLSKVRQYFCPLDSSPIFSYLGFLKKIRCTCNLKDCFGETLNLIEKIKSKILVDWLYVFSDP